MVLHSGGVVDLAAIGVQPVVLACWVRGWKQHPKGAALFGIIPIPESRALSTSVVHLQTCGCAVEMKISLGALLNVPAHFKFLCVCVFVPLGDPR